MNRKRQKVLQTISNVFLRAVLFTVRKMLSVEGFKEKQGEKPPMS